MDSSKSSQSSSQQPPQPPPVGAQYSIAPSSFQKVAAWQNYNSSKTPPTNVPPAGLEFMNPHVGAVMVPSERGFPPTPLHSSNSVTPASNSATPASTDVFNNFTLLTQFSGHSKSVAVLKFSPCGSFIATGSADKLIKIWRVEDFACDRILADHKLGVNDISWSSDSKSIVSASDDKTVKIFDVTFGNCRRTLKGHTNYVFCCAFNPQSSLIVSGGFDESVRVWDTKNGQCTRTLPAHSDPVTSVAFSPDGALIASASYDGYVRIWDVSNGQCVKSLVGTDSPPVTFVKFSPNGKFLLASSLDSTMRLWDHEKGKPMKMYKGHENNKYCLFANFSVVGGKFVVSGSENGKVCVWEIQSKTLVQTLESHTEAVLAVDCHPTERLLASAGLEPDHEIRIWRSQR